MAELRDFATDTAFTGTTLGYEVGRGFWGRVVSAKKGEEEGSHSRSPLTIVTCHMTSLTVNTSF